MGFQGMEVIALKRAGLLPPIGRARDNRMWAIYASRHTGRKGDHVPQLIELRNGDVREEAIGLRVAQLYGQHGRHRYARFVYASIIMPHGEPERIYNATEKCNYCGDGPCPHPDVFVPATGKHGCTGPHANREV